MSTIDKLLHLNSGNAEASFQPQSHTFVLESKIWKASHKGLASVKDEIAALSTLLKDTCPIQQYADRLAVFETELKVFINVFYLLT